MTNVTNSDPLAELHAAADGVRSVARKKDRTLRDMREADKRLGRAITAVGKAMPKIGPAEFSAAFRDGMDALSESISASKSMERPRKKG